MCNPSTATVRSSVLPRSASPARPAGQIVSPLNQLVRFGLVVALVLGAVAAVHAQAVLTVTGPLWDSSLVNNQYQLYRVSFNQAATRGGNVAQVTWPNAPVPVWAGISAYDDSKDDAVNGLLAMGQTSFASKNPLMNTIAAIPNCNTAVIKVRNLSRVTINPSIQWFKLSANVPSITWTRPAAFSRVAGGVSWTNNNTQGTLNLLNTGGVAAYDLKLTILDPSRKPLTPAVAVASRVGANAPLALTFAVPHTAHVGEHLYLQLSYHFCGEADISMFSVYVGQ